LPLIVGALIGLLYFSRTVWRIGNHRTVSYANEPA
jgi:hypothetical protein